VSDRTVHGWSADGGEIVRYDRAGKWFLEYKDRPRARLSVLAAARFARQGGAFLGRPGGARFDKAVQS
jgi:hypothetical protein